MKVGLRGLRLLDALLLWKRVWKAIAAMLATKVLPASRLFQKAPAAPWIRPVPPASRLRLVRQWPALMLLLVAPELLAPSVLLVVVLVWPWKPPRPVLGPRTVVMLGLLAVWRQGKATAEMQRG